MTDLCFGAQNGCESNFELCDGLTDLNECRVFYNGGCQHNCVNTIGSYFCTCDRGFFLSKDGQSCEGAASSLLFQTPFVCFDCIYCAGCMG